MAGWASGLVRVKGYLGGWVVGCMDGERVLKSVGGQVFERAVHGWVDGQVGGRDRVVEIVGRSACKAAPAYMLSTSWQGGFGGRSGELSND